jgi:hypothetical protein
MTDRTVLIAICLLNILLRLPLLALDVVPTSDFEWYYDAARSIASGQGFADKGILTAFWPVGWPAFLGGLLWIFGSSVQVGQIANLLLSVGMIILIKIAGKQLFPGPTWRLAAVIIAIFPNQIAYVPLLSVEIFFEFLLLLGFVLISGRSAIISGLAFGIAALTKTQAVFLPAILSLPFVPSRLRAAILGTTVMLIVIASWTIRNYTVFHAFIPVSTNGGYTLLTGNNPSANGRYTWDDPLVADLSKNPADQVAADHLAADRAWTWIKDHPTAFVRLIPLKIWRLWSGDGEAEWLYQSGYAGYDAHATLFRSVRIINQIFYLAILALSAAALPLMWQQRRSLLPWCWSGWAAILYFTAISVVFSGQSRFHFALMPFIALYAAFFITSRRTRCPST